MVSLRARLVAGLRALAAIGLLTLGGIIYAEQRSFLLERVDDQLRAVPASVARALADRDTVRLPTADRALRPTPAARAPA